MLVPPEVSRAQGRHAWALVMDDDGLEVRASFSHPRGGGLILLGDFRDYPALPPIWRFVDADGGSPLPVWPSAGAIPGFSSIFIIAGNQPIICAHFSRLAYGEHGGPHGDWGGATRWRDIQQGARAETLGDMLAVIARHVAASPGRMG